MRTSRTCPAFVLSGVLAISLAGCTQDARAGSVAPVTQSPSAGSTTSTLATASAGDLAACKAYLLDLPQMQEVAGGLAKIPMAVIPTTFNEFAAAFDRETRTATDPALAEALKGTAAAWRAAATKANIYPPGGVLNLNAELKMVHEESQHVATICLTADPKGAFFAIGNVR